LFLKIGFDPCGHTTGFVLWCNGSGIMVDPPPFSNSYLKSMGINPAKISAIIITHCHADHDAGAIEKILFEKKIEVTYFPFHTQITANIKQNGCSSLHLFNILLFERLSQQERSWIRFWGNILISLECTEKSSESYLYLDQL